MLAASHVLMLRFEKVLEQARREFPDMLDTQVIGLLEMLKFNMLTNNEGQSEEDDELEEYDDDLFVP